MKVSIIGTGYVGLVTGVCLSYKGHSVKCYDKDEGIVNKLNNSVPTIYENGLDQLLKLVVKNKLFSAEVIDENTLFDSQLIIIAVGTPTKDGKIDLSQILNAARRVGEYIKYSDSFVSVIIKSTVVPGTTDTQVLNMIEETSNKSLGLFGLGMNPEFLREGDAIKDALNPDRIVLGHEDEKTLFLLKELYKPWDVKKVAVNTRTAEMIKYANNSLLAMQISAANEIANISQEIGGIDVLDVMEGVFLDKRWSPIIKSGERINPGILNYLIPGCGFGGSCFPKDIDALRHLAESLGYDPIMLKSVIKTNNDQPYQVIKLLKNGLGELNKKDILVLGLAFKPETDDIRESIAIDIINYLIEENVNVFAHDPIAINKMQKFLGHIRNITYISKWEGYLEKIDAVIILTKWNTYNSLSEQSNKDKLKNKVIIDPRRQFAPAEFKDSKYLTIGRRLK
tara:strand:+ start:520 stop:1875 length:1356 start_codon:yes stop_codon:yes gene_type:complete